MSLMGDLMYSARLPDLAPCDYFLWGYLSIPAAQRLCQKINTREETANIAANMLERLIRNSRIRFNPCIDNSGRHLPDMVFKMM